MFEVWSKRNAALPDNKGSNNTPLPVATLVLSSSELSLKIRYEEFHSFNSYIQ
jgi:hypothetical protein